ncbi:MAG: ABC transporter substrate-binding protein [Bacteroidales bacterium]
MNVFSKILIIALLVTFAGCRPVVNQTDGPAPAITIQDFRGKQVAISKPAERIICLIESSLSGLYMLGAENRVIGIPMNVYDESVYKQYAALDERIRQKTLPAPGNWDFVNIESVVALQPDLVIVWSAQKESIETIESHGIPVYAVFLQNTDDICKEMMDLGKLTDKEERADSLISYTKEQISRISTLVNPGNHGNSPTVYFSWSSGFLETSGSTSTVNEVIEFAGGKNVCFEPREHMVVNIENILEWNPDFIILWYNPSGTPADILKLSELKQVNAIKNKAVYQIPSVFMCDLWTLKYQYAVKIIAKWIHPGIKELDLETEQRNMLLRLYGPKGKTLTE